MKKLPLWWHKLTHYEYWPFDLFYFPIYFYFIWLAIKHRSFFFFTAANPGIEFGGMLGERKSQIYDKIPSKWIPKTLLFQPGTSSRDLINRLGEENLFFPIICKPNIGERGWMVEKIDNLAAIHRYLEKIKVEFLVQEYIDEPIELGLFYVRYPGQKSGKITSITKKGFLSVTGDGSHTIDHLLKMNKRALLTFNFKHPEYQDIKESIPTKGEEVLIENIGNHCRGTTFLDITGQKNQQLEATINRVMSSIDGVFFARLDLRCRSLTDLANDQNWKILELNGAGAEPGHVYQPGFGILNAYRVIMNHLHMLSEIAAENRKLGHKYWSLSRGLRKLKEIRNFNRSFK